MAKQRKQKMIAGPNGEAYPVHILNPQIVKSDTAVRNMIDMAEKLSDIAGHYWSQLNAMASSFLEETAGNYGEKWQGNAVLKTYDGSMAVEIDVQQQKSYDERLQVASEKIRRWLDSKLEQVSDPGAKRLFEQVSQIAKTALRIDHKGNVDQKKLIQLRKFEFAGEPEWQEAMELIAQSERVTGTKRYLRFKKVSSETGKLENITVDFSRF